MESENKAVYAKARKEGIKTSSYYKARGWNSHVPVLDNLVSRDDILNEVSLGLVEVPASKVKGTRTNGRSSAFAPDFMPLLEDGTEFSMKWQALYNSHMKEGIRDPVKLYEYLNWFYAEEGNKRVSVLKFVGAATIQAQVTRLIPKYDPEDAAICRYYEFLEFYKKTGINFIWFEEEDGFAKFYQWIVKTGLDTQEGLRVVKSVYYAFRRVYKQLGGDAFSITTGEALLKYLDVYPGSHEEDKRIEGNLRMMWKEFELGASGQLKSLETDADSLERKGLFQPFPDLLGKRTMRIAFIHVRKPEESEWVYGHELGRRHLENVLGDAIRTEAVFDVPESEASYEAIKEAAGRSDVVFTTSPALASTTLKASMAFKDVKFLNCSENMSFRHLRTYYGRMYEANYLAGIIAGALTRTDVVGYAVTYPIPSVISSVNAFTLGAQFVNPYVNVFVKWVDKEDGCDRGCYAVDRQLKDMGADLVYHQESSNLSGERSHSGLYFIDDLLDETCEPVASRLANAFWNWGIFYEKIVRNILSGTYSRINSIWSPEEAAISYWWGLDTGVVDLIHSTSKLPQALDKTLSFVKEAIAENTLHPFQGPIVDQKGYQRVLEGERISNEAIMKMDWFVQGVSGAIPSVDIKGNSQTIFERLGVKKKYQS